MPRFTNDGRTKVTVATIADKDHPAVSELIAGEDIECLLTGDGLNITFNENAVDDAALCEQFDAELPGTVKVTSELTLKRLTGEVDTGWVLFNTRNEEQTLAVRQGPDADVAWTAGQQCEVYPGTVGIRQPLPPTRNTQARFKVMLYSSEEPGLDGLVVAS